MAEDKVASYARPTRCPCNCYEMSSTPAHRAICLSFCYAMSGTDLSKNATSLRACYAMSGTDLANAATSVGARSSSTPPATIRTELAYQHGDIVLRTSYAMSGPEPAYAAIALRACYATRSTIWSYWPTRRAVLGMHIVLSVPYRMACTDRAYCATSPLRGTPQPFPLGGIYLRACYAMCGTDVDLLTWYLPTRLLCYVRTVRRSIRCLGRTCVRGRNRVRRGREEGRGREKGRGREERRGREEGRERRESDDKESGKERERRESETKGGRKGERGERVKLGRGREEEGEERA
eukprot:1496338-Rhodomonas_salina.1